MQQKHGHGGETDKWEESWTENSTMVVFWWEAVQLNTSEAAFTNTPTISLGTNYVRELLTCRNFQHSPWEQSFDHSELLYNWTTRHDMGSKTIFWLWSQSRNPWNVMKPKPKAEAEALGLSWSRSQSLKPKLNLWNVMKPKPKPKSEPEAFGMSGSRNWSPCHVMKPKLNLWNDMKPNLKPLKCNKA